MPVKVHRYGGLFPLDFVLSISYVNSVKQTNHYAMIPETVGPDVKMSIRNQAVEL